MVKQRLAIAAAMLMLAFGGPALAQESVVIATVNDQPVTTFDIDQRVKLMEILGQKPGAVNRKEIGNILINDLVKISEAKRYKIEPTDKDLDDRLKGVAKGMNTDMTGLQKKVTGLGVSMAAFRQYFMAQMSFGRLLGTKYREQVKLDPGDVDKKLADIKAEINGKVAKIEADPRRQPVTVYSILQIDFPVEGNDPQLLQSRAIEIGQYLQKFKGCGSARAAASGIFNVKVGKAIDADAKRLPKQLKAALESRGVGHAIGPVRGPAGLQAIAFCGTRKIVPPKLKVEMPTRQQVETMALNEKFTKVEQKYTAIMRKNAVIEYKDQSYAQ